MKIASEPWEFEAIHRLNYRTFVEEIPQHPRNAEERLVDRFHAENTYAIGIDGDALVGMVCGRSRRPFSLDQKLAGLDSYLPRGRRVFEIRLLAVEPRYRRPGVFAALAGLLARHFRQAGFDLAVISGTTRQLRLYQHLGFVPFGPTVGTGEARFQPMYLTLESFLNNAKALAPRIAAATSYLSGPVEMHAEVRKAFAADPESHRSERFLADFDATRRMLCDLVGARHVEILLGSGTLANDAVAAQLALPGERGLVMSNGEFGERLVDQASRLGLGCEVMRVPWGTPFDYREVWRRLSADKGLRWLWAVHCETSSGMLNDAEALKAAAIAHRAKLCLDCISSIGSLPVSLAGVHLASGVSGKALGSFAGLAMVFHDSAIAPSEALPRYLDLGYYAAQGGVPFTASSNLVSALQAALQRASWPQRFQRIARTAEWLRRELRAAGFDVVAPEAWAAPAVTTLALPAGVCSRQVGARLRKAGFLAGYQSAYLLERNWLQVSLMGEFSEANLQSLIDTLRHLRAPALSRRPVKLAGHRQPA